MNVGDTIWFRAYPGIVSHGTIMLIDEGIVVKITSVYRKGTLDIINKRNILSVEEVKAMEVQDLRATLAQWVDDTTDEGIVKATELLKGLMNE